MMTAIADGLLGALKSKSGYHICLMCPPSLTKKWPDEIRELIPHASVHVINNTSQLIQYHAEWVKQGKPKPTVPTFFVISFTTMRGDARTVPAVEFRSQYTSKQKLSEDNLAYRYGFHCNHCGQPHQTIESYSTEIDENGNEFDVPETHTMTPSEFGETRRISSSSKPANAFCSHCGESLWTKKVATRYHHFSEWVKHESKLTHAIHQKNSSLFKHIQSTQIEAPKLVAMPRRVATIEYIRRKMKNFFDMAIVDEVHERVRCCLINSRKL